MKTKTKMKTEKLVHVEKRQNAKTAWEHLAAYDCEFFKNYFSKKLSVVTRIDDCSIAEPKAVLFFPEMMRWEILGDTQCPAIRQIAAWTRDDTPQYVAVGYLDTCRIPVTHAEYEVCENAVAEFCIRIHGRAAIEKIPAVTDKHYIMSGFYPPEIRVKKAGRPKKKAIASC